MTRKLLTKEFFHDNKILAFCGLSLVLGLVNAVFVFLNVSQQELEVPIRYSQFGSSPISQGDWFTLYELAVFAIVVTLVNVLIAVKLHGVKRNLSYAVLSLNVVVMVFLFMVSRAIIGLSPAS